MRLREFLDDAFVVQHLTSRDVEGIVGEVAAQAEKADVAPAEVVREKLLERERLHPTVMGAGLAIPHATVPGLEAPVIGVALAPDPVPFGGEEMDPVRAFFILLSPPGHEREHVKLLARICRLARHQDFLDQLGAAEDGSQVMAVVTAVDDQHV
jgi:PTS system nitrogen regulatory IIA component